MLYLGIYVNISIHIYMQQQSSEKRGYGFEGKWGVVYGSDWREKRGGREMYYNL